MSWNVIAHSRYTINVYSVSDCFQNCSSTLSVSFVFYIEVMIPPHAQSRLCQNNEAGEHCHSHLSQTGSCLTLQDRWACCKWWLCHTAVGRWALHQNLRLFFGTSYKFYLFWIIILHFFDISNESIKAMENVNHINQNRQNKYSFTLK